MHFSKHLCWLFLLFLWNSSSFGRTTDLSDRIDSLQHVALNSSDTDLNRYQSAKALAIIYENIDLDSAIIYVNLSLDLLSSGNQEKEQIDLLLRRALSYTRLKNIEASISDLDAAYPMALQSQDNILIADVLHGYSLAYQQNGKMIEAIGYNLEAEQLYQSAGDSAKLILVYAELARAYTYTENKEQSIHYEHQVAKLALLTKDSISMAKSYNNLAVEYEEDGQPDEALKYYLLSFELRRNIQDTSQWTYVLYNIVSVSSRMGKTETAESYANLLQRAALGRGNPNNEYIGNLGLAELYISQNRMGKARPYISKALGLKGTPPGPDLRLHAYKMLALSTEKAGLYAESLAWYQQEQDLTDSLQMSKKKAIIEGLQTQYDSQAKDVENAKLQLAQTQSEVRRIRFFWISILVGSGLMIFLGFMIWNNRRKTLRNQALVKQGDLIQSQNETLQIRNEQLDQLNKEKDALMGIVAHDLKAPLSKAEGLLSILQTQLPAEGVEREVVKRMEQVFEQGNSLIEELVLLNELDSDSKSLQLESVDVSILVNHAAEAFAEVAEKKQIQLKLDLPNHAVQIKSHAPYLQRILDNLLSNALKFSLAETIVTLSVRPGAERLELEVRDQGPGISQEEIPFLFEKFTRLSNRPTGGESSTGLGLSIVDSLVHKLGGQVSVDSEVGVGTAFVVGLPMGHPA